MPRRSAPLTIFRLPSLLPQTEKAYQKQVGVNVGYVSTRRVSSRPRSDPKARDAMKSSTAKTRAHRDLPFRNPADSPLPPRRRRPARLALATTRTSVSASRLPGRLSRVRAVAAVPRARPRPARRHRGKIGLSLCGNEGVFQQSTSERGSIPSVLARTVRPPTSSRLANISRTPPRIVTRTTGTYIDKKCPFTGNVSIRGRILTGVVKSTKMKRTIIIRMDYLHYIKKYQRYEKRHTNLAAHISPCFRCKEGDTVVVGQCRPLSKTVRFNTLKVIAAGSKAGKSFAAN